MQSFIATEFDTNTCEPTGYTETYLARSLQDAYKSLAYTRSLYAGTVVSISKYGTVVYGRRNARFSIRRGYTMIASESKQ